MLKNIAKGYGQLFSSILKILFLLALCVACAAVVVIPLWKFATVSPKIYTICALSVILILAVFVIIRKIKSSGAKKSLVSLAKFLVIFGGLFSIFVLVIYGMKLLALPVLVLMVFLYGILRLKRFNAD